MREGDEVHLMDGRGCFYDCKITSTSKSSCGFCILQSHPQPAQWEGHLHLAIAPTKNIDRIEWMVEKATEIGFDEITFLDCQFSERRQLKLERIERILISAIKQSRKPFKPVCNGVVPFQDFIKATQPGAKYICHCYGSENEVPLKQKLLLKDCLAAQSSHDALVMIGPEGDFSIQEVGMAEDLGFQSVSLGRSRLRTETAGLVAVHLMHLFAES